MDGVPGPLGLKNPRDQQAEPVEPTVRGEAETADTGVPTATSVKAAGRPILRGDFGLRRRESWTRALRP